MPKFLKQASENKPKPSVVKMLHSELGGYESARPLARIHGSDLTKEGSSKFCPRMYALLKVAGKKPSDVWVDAPMRVTWDSGTAIQKLLNNVWLGKSMVGNWRCTSCGAYREFSKRPKNCMSDAQQVKCNWDYVEPVFQHAISKATCSLDVLLDMGLGKLVLVEVKTIKSENGKGGSTPNFKELKMPLSEHRLRTQLYLKLIAESGTAEASQILTDWAVVLYVCRGHGFNSPQYPELGVSPFKEFVVQRNDDAVQEYVNMAHALSLFRRNPNVGMPCGVCASVLDKRAQDCIVAKQCFSDKYPACVTWEDGLGKPVHENMPVVVDGKTNIGVEEDAGA